jgi:hypothetical protein
LAPGQTLTATWDDIPAAMPRDWVGLYRPGADNKDRLIWNYVSCTKTPGAARPAGACPFTLPTTLAPGEYELRLYSDDAFEPVLATSSLVTVTGPAVSLSVDPASVQPGDRVTVTWDGIPDAAPTDWIGLFRPGQQDAVFRFVPRVYVSCATTPGAARPSGSCSFAVPAALPPGAYELRLFAGGSLTRLGVSNPLTVTGGGGGEGTSQGSGSGLRR